MTEQPVTFSELTRAEAEALLVRHHVGRIAFSFKDRVDIEPIHYVFADDALYGRTTPGTKLTILAHSPWVAFEVDEIDGPFDWRSVVAKGTVYFPERGGSKEMQEAYDHAISVIRSAFPPAFTDEDPVPERSILFRLHLDSMEGRAASSR
jgi:nitroimidazol reductase NimA-like FMN-containing flavoprotein (pyridoxamine 5'-phosphate oxidase superfamily)